MNCERALELISAELDGELTQQERAELQAHLDACPDCRETYAQLHELDAALQESELEPPAALYDGVMQTIRREKKRRRPAWLPAAAIAAAAALALLAGRAGIIALPGFGGDEAASNDVGVAAQRIWMQTEQDDDRSDEAAAAAELAAETGADVLLVWGEAPQALAQLPYQTLDGGARLYEVTGDVCRTLLDAREDTVQAFAPDGGEAAFEAQQAAYILLLG